MSLINSRFYDNMSNRGGAISAQTDSYNPIRFIVETSKFINNKAENAGAIYVSNHIMQIRNWNFESNRAYQGDGGSLYLGCPSYD